LVTDPNLVVMTPGSKAALYALMNVLAGDLVLPVPSWVTYAAQAALAGKRVIGVPISSAVGGIPDPIQLVGALAAARLSGADPGILMITTPDNPTGTIPGKDLLRDVIAIAEVEGLVIISDEIYRDLAYDPADFVSPAALAPDRTFVTFGLSKGWALGGWRVGMLRAPNTDLGAQAVENVTGLASQIWSCVSTPMASVATVALDEPPELVRFVSDARVLHQAVSQAVYGVISKVGGIDCRRPTAAFYLYVDCEERRAALEGRRIRDSEGLARAMLDDFGVAVLPGSAFGSESGALEFRIATSLLYGRTDKERWEALDAAHDDSVLKLPRIGQALDRLADCLGRLVS
jgi:aspartate aminotransferase